MALHMLGCKTLSVHRFSFLLKELHRPFDAGASIADRFDRQNLSHWKTGFRIRPLAPFFHGNLAHFFKRLNDSGHVQIG